VILKEGDKVTTYILKFNPADKRILLSVNEPSDMEIETAVETDTEEE
jgi:ribosomal protein S1